MSDERDLNALIREALPNHSAPHALREWTRERAQKRLSRFGRWARTMLSCRRGRVHD